MSPAQHVRGLKTSALLRAGSKQSAATRTSQQQPWYSALHRIKSVTRNRAVLATIPDADDQERSPQVLSRAYNHNQDEPRVTALKDNFVTRDLPTTCASLILQGFTGPQDSTVANLLQDAGVLVAAKTNMDEFGMGSHSINSAYGAVRNGIDEMAQSAGGSSGGSAMAVADTMVRVAIGSDTGGSVRLPAAYTGTVGFKPSYGRISRNGLVPYANSLDTVGIISTTVLDAMKIFKILDKYDPADPTCQTPPTRQRVNETLLRRDLNLKPDGSGLESPTIRVIPSPGHGSINDILKMYPGLDQNKKWRRWRRSRKIKIGVPEEYNIQEMSPLVRQAWLRTLSMLSQQGHIIQQISLPTTQQALAAYYVLAPAEASSNLAKYDGVRYGMPRSADHPDNHEGPLYAHYRGELFGDEVKRRILLGTFSLSAGAMDNYFIQAQKVRRLVQRDFNTAFSLPHPLIGSHSKSPNPDGVDLIVVPTAPTTPPLISEVESQSPLDSYINDVFTVPASLAGLPAISVPVIAADELAPLPERNIGMQVIGQYGDDLSVLNFARHQIEAHMNIEGGHETRTLSRKSL